MIHSRKTNRARIVRACPVLLVFCLHLVAQRHLVAGLIVKEFHDIGGTSLSDLTNHGRFPREFDSMTWASDFETKSDSRDNYGVLVQGYLRPPVSGEHTFYLNSDDRAALFLSTDENPGNKRLIAFEPEWNPARNWVAADRRPNRENISVPIRLESGRRYFIEALMKEGNGGDNLGVAWRKPGDPEIKNGDAPIPGKHLEIFPLPLAASNAPQPPESLEAETLLTTRLLWSSSTSLDAPGYLVERSADNGAWEGLFFTKATEHMDDTLAPEKQYRYRIRAVTAAGETGPPSRETPPAAIPMLIRQIEDYNHSGGLYPGFANAPAAVEAPASDNLESGFDYFYQFADSSFPPNPYRPDSMVVVDEDPDPVSTRHIVGWTSTGDWWRYTFDVPAAGWVRFALKAATPGLANVQIFWDERHVATVPCSSGDWNRYQQFEADQRWHSEAGRHTLRLRISDSASNLDYFGIQFGAEAQNRRPIYQETFEAYPDTAAFQAQAGWTIDNGSLRPDVAWSIRSTGDEPSPGFLAGMNGHYMAADSGLEPRAQADESLTSPVIDCRGFSQTRLHFTQNTHFRKETASRQQCDVELDTLNEATGQWRGWLRIFHRERTDGEPATIAEIPIGALADGQRIRLRWRFFDAEWDYWWAIDNIQVTGERSEALAAPAVASLKASQGATSARPQIFLANVVTGSPAQMIASERADFSGAEWQPYAPNLRFTLSPAPGSKTVYFKARNAAGDSEAASVQVTLPAEGPALKVLRSMQPRAFDSQTVDVTLELTYLGAGSPSSIALEESLPLGWVFDAVVRGPALSASPARNQTGILRFEWATAPQLPFPLVYRIRFAGGQAWRGEISGSASLQVSGQTIMEPIAGAAKPGDMRSDQMFHRVLYHGTVLSSTEWDWIAAAGYTLVHTYAGDPQHVRQQLNDAQKRGMKLIAGSSGGAQTAWLRLELDRDQAGAPSSLRVDVRHHYLDAHPSVVFFAEGHPLHLLRIPLENPAWSTIGALANHLNTIGYGISASVEPGKEGARTEHLATWQYGDLANSPQTIFGGELPATYREYVDALKDHPALFCLVPFDDADLTYFSPNFQRYVLSELRRQAPGVSVYLLPRGDAPGTFQHDHKVAYDAYDGYITYIYPGVLPDHVDVVRSISQDWWAFQRLKDPKPWILLGRAFFGPNSLPPKGSIIEQWEATRRAGVPLTGYGFYAWQHDGGQYALAGQRELQLEAREVNRRIEQDHIEARIEQSLRREATSAAEVQFSARVYGGRRPFIIEWDFGDGQKAFGEEVLHRFATPGSRTVTATVLDGAGRAARQTAQVDLLGAVAPSWTENFDGGQAQNFVAVGGEWVASQGVLRPAERPADTAWSYFQGGQPPAYSVGADLAFLAPGGEAILLWSGAQNDSQSRVSWSIPAEPEFTLKGTSLLLLHTDHGMARAHLPFDKSKTNRIVVDVLPSRVNVSVNGRLVLEQPIRQRKGDGFVGFGARQSLVAWDNIAFSPLNLIDAQPVVTGPEPKTAPYRVSFAPNVSGGRPPLIYEWNFGDGGSSAAATPEHEFPRAGAWRASLKVTDADGATAHGSVWAMTGAATYYREAEDYDWTDGAAPGYPAAAERGVRYGAGQKGRRGVDYYDSGEGNASDFRSAASVSLEAGSSDTGTDIHSAGAIDWWNYTFDFPAAGLARIRAYWTADNPPRAAACRVSWNGRVIGDLVFPASNPTEHFAAVSPVFPVESEPGQIQFHPLDWGLSFSRFEVEFVPGTDTDGDGVADAADLDADGDGFLNSDEASGAQSDPFAALSRPQDQDGDRVSDRNDLDDDNDGTPDPLDPFPLSANRPPIVPEPGFHRARAGEEFRLELGAFDIDLPSQKLAYSLKGDVPSGASVDAQGVFTWIPKNENASQTFVFAIQVTDDGSTPLSTERALSLQVTDALPAGYRRVAIELEEGPASLAVPRSEYAFVALNRTLYLATDGNDTNPGTIEQPWRTFAQAVERLEPGDVLYVRAGVYAEPFTVNRAGTPAKPIVISAHPGERVRIVQPDGWQAANRDGSTIKIAFSQHLWLHGFEVEGGWRPGQPHEYGSTERACINVGGSGGGVRILNNLCSRSFGSGIYAIYSQEFLIEGNVVHECGAIWSGVGISVSGCYKPSGIVRGNTILKCGAGLDIGFTQGLHCYNNMVLDSVGIGTSLLADSDNVLAHNLWVGNGVAGLAFASQVATNVVVNNIFQDNAPRHLWFNEYFGTQSSVVQNTFDYSLFDPEWDLASPLGWFESWIGTHLVFADAGFVNPGQFDFRLAPGSLARNAAAPARLLGSHGSPDLGPFPASLYWQPDLSLPSEVEIEEGRELLLPLALASPNTNVSRVVFELVGAAPPGLRIDSARNAIAWTPGEIHGPGEYLVRVHATADDSVLVSSLTTLRVKVLETNESPSASPIAAQTLAEGQTLSLNLGIPDIGITSGIQREVFGGIAGTLVENLTNSARFPSQPSSRSVLANFEAPRDVAENYGQRLRGFVTSPESGLHTFWIASDDGSVLYLSPDVLPANRLPIASVPDWTDYRAWNKFAQQQSLPVWLDAGKSYYVEALMKEGSGGDHLSVRWQLPSGAFEGPIPRSRLTAWTKEPVVYFADPDRPAQLLTYALLPGSPAGATVDPRTGVLTWAPDESQGGATHSIGVRVTDDGTPPKFAEQTIEVLVQEANSPPVLPDSAVPSAAEGAPFLFNPAATDPDLPANQLVWSLFDAPAGMMIDPASGTVAWLPNEAQGGADYSFTLMVTDDGTPPLSASRTLTVAVAEVNDAPVAAPVADRTIEESSALDMVVAATDADLPKQSLTFALVSGAPEGMSIDAGTGTVRWTPSESQGPGNFSVTVRVTDNGSPSKSAETTFAIAVKEANRPPVLGSIEDRRIDEETPLALSLTAADPDIPANSLSWSLGQGAPSGMAIDASTGAILWTPSEAQGGASYLVTAVATDSGQPALSDSRTFSIAVEEVNKAPELTALPSRSADELAELAFASMAADGDLPPQSLDFSLAPGAPDGATIARDGTFRWTPSEAQGPGVYRIAIRVTDDGAPPLSDEKAFEATILEVNSAPVLFPIGDQVVQVAGELAIASAAADPDVPANMVTFGLEQGAPSGAAISETGFFRWKPEAAHAGETYSITVVATDNGIPALSGKMTFRATVMPAEDQAPELSASLEAGSAVISFRSQAGASYQLQARTTLGQEGWVDEGSPLAGDGQQVRVSIPAEGLSRFLRIQVLREK